MPSDTSFPVTSSPHRPSSGTVPHPLRERLAAGRHDYHRHDADLMGIPPARIARWKQQGWLEDLGHGDYVICEPLRGEDRFAQARCAHLRRCETVVRGTQGLYLVGASSALVHGLSLLATPRHVEVSKRPRHRSRRPDVLPRMPWGSDPVMAGDLPCQVIEEAVVEIAATSGVAAGLVSADALLHQGGDPENLQAAGVAFGNRRSARQARIVTALADGRIESPGESLLRWLAHRHDIALTPQVEMRDESGRFVARVDCVVTGTRVVVEFDGMTKYHEPDDLRREKLQQLAIEQLGYHVVRVSFRDLRQEERVVQMLQRAVRAAAA